MIRRDNNIFRRIISVLFLVFLVSGVQASEWTPEFSGVRITYANNIWHKVTERSSPGDSMIVIMDKRDGSVIMLRQESGDEIANISAKSIEVYLYDLLKKKSPGTTITGKSLAKIGNYNFRTIFYRYINPRYGNQILQHAYLKKGKSIVTLTCAWPVKLVIKKGNKLPEKISSIVNTIDLGENSKE